MSSADDPPFIDVADFERVVREGRTAVVAFVATWNRRCQSFAADYRKLADEQKGRAEVVRVDVDENPGLTGSLDISSVPTVVVLRGGCEIYRESTVDLSGCRSRL